MTKPLLVALIVVLAACDADFVPLSGGALTGRVTAPPSDWQQIPPQEVIRLETNPAEPYSVKLWIVATEAALYVHAGANRTTWVVHMEVDPEVKVLIGEQLFELTAERVKAQDEFNDFAAIYAVKYGNRPRNESVEEAYLYRLVPRK